MQQDLTVNSFNQILSIYNVTRQPEVYREASGIRILHTQLVNLIKGILNNSPLTQAERTVSSMMNADTNYRVLAKHGAIPGTKAKISFDLKSLSLDIQRVKEEEDVSTADEFIRMLEDKSKEMEQPTRPQILDLRYAGLQRMAAEFDEEDPANFATRGYAHTRGRMGLSSVFLRDVLTGVFYKSDNQSVYAHPKDAWDLARCIFFLEDYLKEKGRNDLNDEEKNKLRACSGSWRGIVDHLDEFRTAIATNRDWHETTRRLQQCMNSDKMVYMNNESGQLTAEERTEIQTFIQRLTNGQENQNQYLLTGRSRVFANHLIEALHQNNYHIDYHYETDGTLRGDRPLTIENQVSLLDKIDYNYKHKMLIFRKKTPGNQQGGPIIEIKRM